MKKEKKMLSAYTIVFIFLIITAGLTWIVPQSVVVNHDGTKEVIYNAIFNDSGEVLKGLGRQPAGLWDILMAPVKGFEKSSSVSIAILMAGAFLGLINSVGAMDAGIGALLKRYTGTTLIAILMFVFAVFGSVFGFWEEIPAFSIVIVPLFVLAGYDVITGLAVLTVGATAGNMASVVNPFSTGAAIGAIGNPDLSLGSGMVMRMILFVVLYIIGLVFTVKYANEVKANKEKSIVADIDVNTMTHDQGHLPELTKKRFWSVMVLVGIIVLLICGYMPWYEIKFANGTTFQDIINAPIYFLAGIPILGDLLGAKHITPLGDWYFGEFSFVFFLGSILIGFINRIPEEKFVKEFAAGAKDLLGVVLVLAIANGISVLMGGKTSGISVTFVYWIQNALQGIPGWAFSVATVLAYVGIGCFLQSTSGVAGITMPILGAVAMALFQNSTIGVVGGQVMLISAFTLGINFMSGLYPSATTMGTLELFNVPYDRYLKFILKIFVSMLAVGCIIISISQFLGLI
ncbi:YfcC family protein [Candidatus Cetobacterium colombiensis]|uniref:YfcC family protein n=1 Tax=Candidatus Cetobacterium colombiensis TaxID=3073100 RepID=A0ABU4WA48_9FUSO|nr:YfcC family protein [Candidatus Cetobacterium colombiensis]MDX8335451.1 YfcC family protein [Candidatus Cetobacterium colombiensis]